MTRTPQPRRRGRALAAAVVATLVIPVAAAAVPAAAAGLPAQVRTEPAAERAFHSDGNPILADGSYYSADAAPLVDGDTLYVYTGHDEAAEQQAGFEMHDYGYFATTDVASGEWTHQPLAMDPGEVFGWATGDAAYAGQVARGTDGRFYWYAPVQWENTDVPNRMAIGVAVADSPRGPWTDAVGEPLLTWTDVFGTSTTGQEVIDPHVFVDADGQAYLYWGSWGVARAVRLTASMTETTGAITTLQGLDGFYEAPWVFERNGTYYLAYDWKQGGSSCTPSNYQACVAYATASSPLGPWTFQDVVLGGTSATTVHPSVVEFRDRWYLTYHTKDAAGGGHFRRSVAIDEVTWDGDRMLPVTPTRADDPALRLSSNLATGAAASASYTEQPPMTLRALNDGRATTALLPPDQWGNYRGTDSAVASDWVQYDWPTPVRVGGVGIQLHRDGNWIRPPESWQVEYRDAAGAWRPVEGATYPTGTDVWHDVTFTPVTTAALRATFRGLPEGAAVHSVAVSELEVAAVPASGPAETPTVWTAPGTAPELPAAVRMPFGDAGPLWVPVNWLPVDPAAYAEAGEVTVQGRALGQAGGYVTATVVVSPDEPPAGEPDTDAPLAVATATGTEGDDGWFRSPVTVRVRAEDQRDYASTVETRVGDGAWTAGTTYADVVVEAEGSTTVHGRATDAAGNASAPVELTVRVDRTPPVVEATVDPATRAATITVADALSGPGRVEYQLDGSGEWTALEPGAQVAAPDGLPHALAYRATDVAGNLATGTVTIPRDAGTPLTGNVAPFATPSASSTSGWESVAGLNDGGNDAQGSDPALLGASWGTWPEVGEQWAQLSWDFDVTVDQARVWWYQNVDDTAGEGLIAPRSWTLQYLDADGTTWHDVDLAEGAAYGRDRDTFVPVAFAPVTTRAVRVLAQSWGEAPQQGSTGIRELQVLATGDEGPGPDPDPTVVTPAAPTFTPPACEAGAATRGTLTVPEVAGVVYTVDGQPAAGTRELEPGQAVTVVAEPAPGYAFADGPGVLSYGFRSDPVDCGPAADTVVPGTTRVDGEPRVGSPLTAVTESWGPDGVTLAHQWAVDGADVPGATGTTFVPAPEHEGGVVTVRVTGYGPGLVTASATSEPTAAVAASDLPEVTTRPVHVSGAWFTGSTLRARTSGWSPEGTTLGYQWLRDGEPIDGATAATYRLQRADRWHEVQVRVTGTAPDHAPASRTSSAVWVVW